MLRAAIEANARITRAAGSLCQTVMVLSGQSPAGPVRASDEEQRERRDDQVEPDHQHEQPVETRLEPPGREGEEEVAERPEGGAVEDEPEREDPGVVGGGQRAEQARGSRWRP